MASRQVPKHPSKAVCLRAVEDRLVHGWDSIKNDYFYSFLGLSTLKIFTVTQL